MRWIERMAGPEMLGSRSAARTISPRILLYHLLIVNVSFSE